jgi:phospholipase/carboxylesterase
MRNETVTLGELTCRIVRPDDVRGIRAIVVLCHGFGAPGEDLVPLAAEYVRSRRRLEQHVQFVFPAAPLAIPEVPGGRAWWPIDMLELQTAVIEGRFRDLRQSIPRQLPAARDRLFKLIELLQHETGVPSSGFVLGGFSQGAMLATDVALRLPEAPGALIIHSGTLLAESEWKALAPRRAGLTVFQTHGTRDPLLPFESAIWLRDLLIEAGLNVSFSSFPGMHTIPREGVQTSAELIEDIVDATS